MASQIKERTINELQQYSALPLTAVRIVFDYAKPPFYSQKGLSASEKLLKQTKFALLSDPNYKRGISIKRKKEYLVEPNKPFDFKISDIRHDHPNYRLVMNTKKTFAVAMTPGSFSKMEDSYWTATFEVQRQQVKLYFVCDGHNDKGQCSEFLQENMPKKLEAELSSYELNDENITNALTTVCFDLSYEYNYEYNKAFNTVEACGGTMLTGVLRLGNKYYFPNVGDSRIVFVNQERCQQLTEDAEFSNPRFLKSHQKMGRPIEKEKERIFFSDTLCTGLTRDIGLSHLYPKPKITFLEQEKGFLVLATDGFWDVTSNKELEQAMRQMMVEQCNVLKMAYNLVRGAHRTSHVQKGDKLKDASDNILVLVMKI